MKTMLSTHISCLFIFDPSVITRDILYSGRYFDGWLSDSSKTNNLDDEQHLLDVIEFDSMKHLLIFCDFPHSKYVDFS